MRELLINLYKYKFFLGCSDEERGTARCWIKFKLQGSCRLMLLSSSFACVHARERNGDAHHSFAHLPWIPKFQIWARSRPCAGVCRRRDMDFLREERKLRGRWSSEPFVVGKSRNINVFPISEKRKSSASKRC